MAELQQRYFQGPKLSPEGDRIAMWIAGGNSQVWVYEMERGILTPLTSEGQNFFPVWSPDGNVWPFLPCARGAAVTCSGNPPMAAAPPSASPQANMLSSLLGGLPTVRFSSFTRASDPESGWDIWVLPMEGDRNLIPEPFLKTPSNEFQPALSPDGHWLAYVSNESGSDESM